MPETFCVAVAHDGEVMMRSGPVSWSEATLLCKHFADGSILCALGMDDSQSSVITAHEHTTGGELVLRLRVHIESFAADGDGLP